MTVQPAVRRDPWRFLWRLSTGDSLLAVAMLLLSLYLAALAIFPQASADSALTDTWLAQAQARFGAATESLYRLGLFHLGDSPLPRLLLAVTGFLLLTRAVEQAAALQSLPPRPKERHFWTALSALLAYAGALLLLVGLLIGELWGWQVDSLISSGQETLTVPGHGEVALVPDEHGVRSARPGVTIHTTGSGPQVTVRALDEHGASLGLQRTPREPTTEELTVALTADSPEAFLAVPDAGLVLRVAAAPGAALAADAPLRIQVFRTPTGELVEENEMGSEALELTLDGTRLQATRSPYRILSAAHNPGRWAEIGGLVIGALGLLGILALTSPRQTRWRWGLRIYRSMASLLTLVVAAITLQSLIASGALWNRTPLPVGLAALLWITLAAGLGIGRVTGPLTLPQVRK